MGARRPPLVSMVLSTKCRGKIGKGEMVVNKKKALIRGIRANSSQTILTQDAARIAYSDRFVKKKLLTE